MSSGITDSSLIYHLQNAKNHGVTQKEIAAVITEGSLLNRGTKKEISEWVKSL